ncbi:MAG: TIGR01841 family phasin [Burkholderiaceae bacterium]
MAQKSGMANPIANFFEAQTAATAEIAHAALNGMQRLQKLTLEAMRAGAGEQMSLAQSMAAMRDGGNIARSASQAAAPVAEQGARYQREMVQAIADMNNDILRASYSMMERMRDALGAAQGSMTTASVLPSMPAGAATANPMAMYDSAMRQWQTSVQQLMEAPAVAMAVGLAEDDAPIRAARAAPSRKPKRGAKRKAGTHPR